MINYAISTELSRSFYKKTRKTAIVIIVKTIAIFYGKKQFNRAALRLITREQGNVYFSNVKSIQIDKGVV